MEIAGKRAIVTGGAAGIGWAVAEQLLAGGAAVAVLDRDVEAVEALALPDGSFALCCDIADPGSVADAIATVAERFGHVDILVNNAGIMRSAPLVNMLRRGEERLHDLKLWQDVIAVNLTGTFDITRHVADLMLAKRTRGVIINISSIAARGNAGQTAYSAAKAGVEAMTQVWAKELGRFRIRAVAVAPGFMDTAGARDALEEAVLEKWREQVPLRRLGTADEVASAVLSAIGNDFLNGCVIALDGGLQL